MPFVVLALGTALHLYTPARMQGRANAAVSSVTGAAQAASIAAGAALIGVLGYQLMYLIMAGTALLCAASVLLGRVPSPDVADSVADGAPDPLGAADPTGVPDAAPAPQTSR